MCQALPKRAKTGLSLPNIGCLGMKVGGARRQGWHGAPDRWQHVATLKGRQTGNESMTPTVSQSRANKRITQQVCETQGHLLCGRRLRGNSAKAEARSNVSRRKIILHV
ncbi:hypothetical protein NQZ68_012095 [Dissostichus eleginoides]|nr:hypothetical protein NQZ68_012095 [Dissostichus eleginoides]